MNGGDGYRSLILSALNERRSRNSLYSLRAFARDLGVSPTALSDGLAGKRRFSSRNAQRIAAELGLAPVARERFVAEAQGRELAPAVEADAQTRTLREDEFRLISDWYYFAILNLAKLPSNQADPGWLARRLGISVFQAREAVRRLRRLGYVEVEGPRLRRTTLPLRTSTDVPSSALRKHHLQNLGRAERALESLPVELREISSMTFAGSTARLAEAKRRIASFRRQLARLMESDEPDEVYTVAVQLFPALGRTAKERR